MWCARSRATSSAKSLWSTAAAPTGPRARARAAGARVILEPRSGYGSACIAGVCATERPVVAFIDGDGSDDPAELPRLVAPILAGEQDFVIGSRTRGVREKGSMGMHQLIAGRIAGLFMRAVYGVR